MPRQAAYDRDAALDKARALFWEKGFGGTSMKDLEARLDMRPGSIYAAFGSKEELFVEALHLFGQRSRAAFVESINAAESPLAGIAAHIRAFARRTTDDAPSRACMLVRTVLETPDSDPLLRQEAEDQMRKTEALFADAYRQAIEAGDLPHDTDPERSARRLQTELFGLGAYAQRTDISEHVVSVAEDIARDIEKQAVTPQGGI